MISDSAAAPIAGRLAVDVISDIVCPWCYIGKRKLESALGELAEREPDLDIAVRWHPFQLNPDLPTGGMSRASYLAAKFGGTGRAAEIYSRVRDVGAEVGIQGVPFFIFNGRIAVSGAHDPPTLLEAIAAARQGE